MNKCSFFAICHSIAIEATSFSFSWRHSHMLCELKNRVLLNFINLIWILYDNSTLVLGKPNEQSAQNCLWSQHIHIYITEIVRAYSYWYSLWMKHVSAIWPSMYYAIKCPTSLVSLLIGSYVIFFWITSLTLQPPTSVKPPFNLPDST